MKQAGLHIRFESNFGSWTYRGQVIPVKPIVFLGKARPEDTTFQGHIK